MTQLTVEQAAHYRLFGYVLMPGAVASKLAELNGEFARITDLAAHDGKARKLHWQFIDSSPLLAPLLDELGGAFDGIMGPDWQYFGSVGNIYSGDTGWHTDNYAHHHRAKLALYLDPTGPGRGGLSLIPLTQRVAEDINELHLAVGMSIKSIGLHGKEIPCVTVSTEPGDALLFNQNLLHASWGGGDKRRMVSINAHARYREDEMETLRADVVRLARFLTPSFYGRHIVDGGPAGRAAHLEQVLSCADAYELAVAERLAVTSTKAKDPLPDLSLNADPKVAMAEFLRDNDYVAPDSWYAATAP